MKTATNRRFIHVALILFMATVLAFSTNPQVARAQESEPTENKTYLIPIPLPNLHDAELPASIDQDQADKVAKDLMAREVDKILDELRKLKSRGVVEDYTVLSDSPALRVTLAEKDVTQLQQVLPASAQVITDSGETPACVSGGVEHLPEMVLAAARMQDQRTQSAPADSETLAGAAPVISIYFDPGSEINGVSGTVAPDSEVKLRILRGGNEAASDYVWSGADGYFEFTPQYISCPQGHYIWELQAGDVVEVTAAGMSSSTTVTPITGMTDTENEIIRGSTSANQTVKMQLWTMSLTDACQVHSYTMTAVSDATGKFTFEVGGYTYYDRSAKIMLSVMDATGNSTYYYMDIYHLFVSEDDFFSLYLPAATFYNLGLWRNMTEIEYQYGTTDDQGFRYGKFTTDVLPGDQVIVQFAGILMRYDVVAWPKIWLDRATGQLSGSAGPSRWISVNHPDSTSLFRTGCSNAGSCKSQFVRDGDSVSLNIGPVYNGEEPTIIFYAGYGESIHISSFEPSLVAYPDDDEVAINWWDNKTLTVTLKDSANAVKETVNYNNSWLDSYYWVSFNVDVLPGDTIEVTDGTNTLSMTVGDLSGVRVNYNTNQASGAASVGHLLAEVSTTQASGCAEMDQTAPGAFTLNPGIDVLGGSSTKVNLRGSDGGYTIATGSSFYVRLSAGENTVYGNTETANPTVSWKHKRGTAVLGNGTTSALNNTYLFATTVTPQVGDVLELTTSDGNSATVTYPELTLQLDPAQKRAYGKAPASQRLDISISRDTPDYQIPLDFKAWADASGNYSLHFPLKAYWWKDCTPLNLSDSCQAALVLATLANGFGITNSIYPQPVEADTYEPDNSPEAASIYTGIQNHSLHGEDDVDYIKFTVSDEDVANGTLFSIRTLNTGLNMGLNLELYHDSNPMNPLATAWGANDTSGDVPPTIDYVFSQAGTYYLMIYPDTYDGGHCTSVYTLGILRDPKSVYLPEVTR